MLYKYYIYIQKVKKFKKILSGVKYKYKEVNLVTNFNKLSFYICFSQLLIFSTNIYSSFYLQNYTIY